MTTDHESNEEKDFSACDEKLLTADDDDDNDYDKIEC